MGSVVAPKEFQSHFIVAVEFADNFLFPALCLHPFNKDFIVEL